MTRCQKLWAGCLVRISLPVKILQVSFELPSASEGSTRKNEIFYPFRVCAFSCFRE